MLSINDSMTDRGYCHNDNTVRVHVRHELMMTMIIIIRRSIKVSKMTMSLCGHYKNGK